MPYPRVFGCMLQTVVTMTNFGQLMDSVGQRRASLSRMLMLPLHTQL